MIIWSGWGFLVVIIYFVSNVIVNILITAIMGSAWNSQNYWSVPLTFLVSGVICWFLGKRLNNSPNKVYIDKETGDEVILKKARHRLFFIAMEYWGPILAVFGLVSLLIE